MLFGVRRATTTTPTPQHTTATTSAGTYTPHHAAPTRFGRAPARTRARRGYSQTLDGDLDGTLPAHVVYAALAFLVVAFWRGIAQTHLLAVYAHTTALASRLWRSSSASASSAILRSGLISALHCALMSWHL